MIFMHWVKFLYFTKVNTIIQNICKMEVLSTRALIYKTANNFDKFPSSGQKPGLTSKRIEGGTLEASFFSCCISCFRKFISSLSAEKLTVNTNVRRFFMSWVFITLQGSWNFCITRNGECKGAKKVCSQHEYRGQDRVHEACMRGLTLCTCPCRCRHLHLAHKLK